MSLIKKYFMQAQSNAHEQFLNADGFVDSDLHFTAEGSYFPADGAMPAAAPTSQPYIITVSNSTSSAVANFDVLGAFSYLFNAGFSAGSLTISGVTISSGLSNVTYQQLLQQSQTNPFTVALTQITSIAGSSAQVTQALTLNTQDANGNQALKPIIPTIDPYQFQSGNVVSRQQYRIDGFTKITIASVLPNAVFQMYFYPSDNINLARGLAGNPVSRQFSDPKIVKDTTNVVIKG